MNSEAPQEPEETQQKGGCANESDSPRHESPTIMGSRVSIIPVRDGIGKPKDAVERAVTDTPKKRATISAAAFKPTADHWRSTTAGTAKIVSTQSM